MLGSLAAWCLDTFGDDAPMLIGVRLGDERAGFHPVQLGDIDPVEDLAGLRAPDDWDAAVVVVPAQQAHGARISGVLAHAVDRNSHSATYLDEPCGHRRALHAPTGILHDLCLALF